MDLLEALRLCKAGHKVRPVCWGTLNPYHWVEARNVITTDGLGSLFLEYGQYEEMPHALRLAHEAELLGEWEVLE